MERDSLTHMQDNEGVCLCVRQGEWVRVCAESELERERIRAMMSCLFLLLYDHVLRLCLAGRFLQPERGGQKLLVQCTLSCWLSEKPSVPPGSGWTDVCCAPIGCVCPLLSSLCLGSTPPFHCLLSPFNSTIRFVRSAAAGKIFFLQLLQLCFLIPPPVEERGEVEKESSFWVTHPTVAKYQLEHTMRNINKEDLGMYWPTVTHKMYLDT